ncbi:hypothetical protein L7F22_015630 [Adiantum nelumboides]|nr:hypothetical protein [Adiantum nelumboides]
MPLFFTVKELVANDKPNAFDGKFLVLSDIGSSFLDPMGHGGFKGRIMPWPFLPELLVTRKSLLRRIIGHFCPLNGKITLSFAKNRLVLSFRVSSLLKLTLAPRLPRMSKSKVLVCTNRQMITCFSSHKTHALLNLPVFLFLYGYVNQRSEKG